MSSANAVLEAPGSTTSNVTMPSKPQETVGEQTPPVQVDWASDFDPLPESRESEETKTSYQSRLTTFPTDIEMWTSSTFISNVQMMEIESASAVMQKESQPHAFEPVRTPKKKATRQAQQWLNGDLQRIDNRITSLCIEHAEIMHVPIRKLDLSVKRSWEGEFNELVLQVFVDANLPQSLALWDAIGDSIQRWARRQTTRCRKLLNEQYAVFVETQPSP